MATYDRIADLPLVVERVGYQPHVLEMPRFTRVTTVVQLPGGGEEGLGEDVTYDAETHEPASRSAARTLPLAGELDVRLVLDAGSASSTCSRTAAEHARSTATTAAGRSRARRSTSRCARPGRSLAGGARPRARAGQLRRLAAPGRAAERSSPCTRRLARYPGAALQARRHARLGRRADRRAGRDRRGRLDRLQGRLQGHAGRRAAPTRGSTGACAEAFPDAWLEDPDLDAEPTRRGARARTATGSPGTRRSTRWPTSRRCPFPPRTVNLKPSRFGSLRSAVRRLRLLRGARDRRLRRRPVRARRRPRADPVPGVAVPPRRAQRHRPRRLRRARAAARVCRPARSSRSSRSAVFAGTPDRGGGKRRGAANAAGRWWSRPTGARTRRHDR